MDIDKAIEIKRRVGEEFLNTDPDDIEEADRLSIEALVFQRDVLRLAGKGILMLRDPQNKDFKRP